MTKSLNKYFVAAGLFFIAAILFVVIPLFLKLSDFITAAFIITGMSLTILGSFVIIFSGNEPVDPHLIGLLPIQGCINLYRIAANNGIAGNAFFLPPFFSGEAKVMQFNPVSTYNGEAIQAKQPYTINVPQGIVTIPTCEPLIQDLRKRFALEVPEREEELAALITEIFSEVYEFSPEILVSSEENLVTITLHKYHFIEGCLYALAESPHCCTRYPCPACSLCGSLIAECTKKVVALEGCTVSSSQDITAVFSIIDNSTDAILAGVNKP
jgi:hypothetical protein